MSLLSFVTGAASLFGGNSSGSNTSGFVNTNSASDQASSASESKTGSTTQDAKSSGVSAGTQNTSQTGTTTGKESSQTAGTTTNYSSNVLASLDAILGAQLGNGMAGTGNVAGATDALKGRLQQVQDLANKPAFDVNGYVSGITEAAATAGQSDLDSRINTMLSGTGTSEGGNSMAALLGNKLRNENAANLAGVKANATAQGQQIAQAEQTSITGQISGLSQDIMGNISNLLAAAKGGTQTATGVANTTSNQAQQQTGATNTSQTESLTQNTSQKEAMNTVQAGQTASTGSQTSSTQEKTQDNKNLFDKVLSAFTNASKAA